jgi:hypothetical protein
VYVEVDGRGRPAEPTALDALLGELRAGLEWVRQHGSFDSDKERQRLIGVFKGACAILEKRRA